MDFFSFGKVMMAFLKLNEETFLTKFSLLQFKLLDLLKFKLLDEIRVVDFGIDEVLNEREMMILRKGKFIWATSVH